MIRVENLYKTYNENKKNECKAIKNISFNLSSKGMVFIIGKSGSGKSTLLNLLGGLDSSSSGSIFFNNQNISGFSAKQLENYRNNNIGFIFQDYCLIEGMSVFENIELALALKGEVDNELVMKTISDIGLQEKKDVAVNLLSGGQKQRVAIARAIIKSPSIVLADEPTGNLDTVTAGQTFSILKEISKEKLVIVISHNLNDAYKYADRIIELSEGKIVGDWDNRLSDKENIAILSETSNITDTKLKAINNTIKDFDVEIVKGKTNYTKHQDEQQTNGSFEADTLNDSSKMPARTKFQLFKYFFKRKFIGMFSMIFLLGILVTLTGLAQTFNNISEYQLLANAVVQDTSPLIFRKGVYDDYSEKINTSLLGSVTEEDIKAFEDGGYDGEMFKLYRFSIPIIYNYDNITMGKPSSYNVLKGFYLQQNGNGVLQCSEEYLVSKYGIDGELKVLSGSLNAEPYGIVVTDFFADSILNLHNSYISNSGDRYEKLTSATNPLFRRYKINAVISTGYLERYSWLVEKIEMIRTYPVEAKKYFKEIRDSGIASEFNDEVNNFLAIGYTFNENFIEDTLTALRDVCFIHFFENIEITSESNEVLFVNDLMWQTVDNVDLVNKDLEIQDDEVYVSADLYNKMFNTNLTYENSNGFEERDVYYNLYSSGRKFGEDAKYVKKLTIKGLIPYAGENVSVFSDNTFKELRRIDMSAYSLYCYGGINDATLYQNAEGLYYKGNSDYIDAIQNIINILLIFKDIFVIIFLGLFVISILMLSSYIARNIISRKREIGIIRAIGARNIDAAVPFNMLSAIIGVGSGILSTIGFICICNYANTLISTGFATVFDMPILESLNLITFNPLILFIDIIILFGIISLSLLISVFTLKKIKVIEIMRKE